MLLAVGVGLWIGVSSGPRAAGGLARDTCNGRRELCGRPLDTVVFATAHNAMGSSDQPTWMFPAQEAGIQVVFYYALALVVVWYVFDYTPLGRYLYFVGAGRDVARLSGIRVSVVRAGSLVAAGLLSALAGVLLAGVLGSANPNIGNSYLLPAFAG